MRRAANAILVLTIVMLAIALTWIAVHPIDGVLEMLQGDAFFDVILIGASIALAWLGRLIVRRSANRIGLAFLGVALGTALIGVCDIPLKSATVPHPSWLSLVAYGTIIGRTLVIACLTIVLLLFPTGSLPSPRWRWVAWLWLAGSIGFGISALLGQFEEPPGLTNPIHVEALTPLGNALGAGGIALLFVFAAGIASLVIKARQGNTETRALVRLLSLVVGVALIGFATAAISEPGSLAGILGFALFLVAVMVGIPAALIIPVLKYRLYDIDLVIKKTVVFGLLAVFITAVYAAIVAVVSQLFEGSQAGSFLAATALAILFAPARDRARKIADRLVYGKRATPYEVLAEFSDRVGAAYAADDVLHRMAQVLEEGTGAVGTRVLLQVGADLREAASIGERGEDETVVAVVHQGEELGALAVTMPASDPMNPAKLQLVEDLAGQAGLVLRNVKLIEELKASRQRLVAAQDQERRKIERNIHDGAQQQLVALAVQLKLAAGMVGKDEPAQRELLAKLAVQTNEALEDLRDLARGIYPPLLQDKGLPAALEAQARKAVIPTTVQADGVGRFDQATESAVYFSCLEALQNVAKYADATQATITLSNGDGSLRFTVTDDGRGFDANAASYGTGLQGIADRLAAIGGILTVASTPGQGTTIAGTVPVGVAA